MTEKNNENKKEEKIEEKIEEKKEEKIEDKIDDKINEENNKIKDDNKNLDENNNKNIDKKNELKNNEKNIDFIKELNYIKNSSKTNYSWDELKNYFIEYYKTIVNNFTNNENENIKNEEEKTTNIDEEIIYYLTNMSKMPFTLQRMAELILEPKKYYETPFKFNYAFKKLVNIELD
jgi:hypothetical protein